jgi:integrase
VKLIDFLKDHMTQAAKRVNLNAAQRYRFWLIACTISRHTGMRLSDICQLEWSAIKPKRITVLTDNKDAQVDLPLTKELAAAVSMISKANKTYCFPLERQVSLSNKRAKLPRHFMHVCESLEFDGLSFGSLRSAYISECQKKGVPMPHISVGK